MDRLRNDDVSEVCSYLTIKELLVFSCTCKKTKSVVQGRADWVWRDLALTRWLFCRVNKYANWRDLYINRHQIEKHMQKADKFQMIACRGHTGIITALRVYGDAIYTG